MKKNKLYEYRTFADIEFLLTDEQNAYIERELYGYGLVKLKYGIKNKKLVKTLRLIKDRLWLTVILSKNSIELEHKINNKLAPMV